MTSAINYLHGFGNEHETEALADALPRGQFSPQRVNYNLYAEQFNTTAFTASRSSNRRSWFYRIRPSVSQGKYYPIDNNYIRTSPLTESRASPERLRWDPLEIPSSPTDFIDGLMTMAVNGNTETNTGVGIHLYVANQSMNDRYFCVVDGELLIVPQSGGLAIATECGHLIISPGEIAVIPRGMKFSISLTEDTARGYVCENYGSPFVLAERGPVGANGYANDRDFLYPVAAFEDKDDPCQLITKFAGQLYACDLDHCPLDVVAWTGNSAPYKYDLSLFNVINTVSFDHPDPSIFTVLTSQTSTPGTANLDFVIFPPRWMVAEHTFRPPYYHRNVMNEFMGLIQGVYDAKKKGFLPGGASLHNCMSPHGPEASVFNEASEVELKPERYRDTLAFMFESCFVMTATKFAVESSALQKDYVDCWKGLEKKFTPEK